ncbi:hypothetical protein KEM54_004100, partial [Ascosphaera aggregata]
GGVTILVAIVGFFWLPRSAGTAWFLTQDEADWAEERVRFDRNKSKDEVVAHDAYGRFRYSDDAPTIDEERRLLDPEPISDQTDSASGLSTRHGQAAEGAQSDNPEAVFQAHLVSDQHSNSPAVPASFVHTISSKLVE